VSGRLPGHGDPHVFPRAVREQLEATLEERWIQELGLTDAFVLSVVRVDAPGTESRP
jgi:hypothetical protein